MEDCSEIANGQLLFLALGSKYLQLPVAVNHLTHIMMFFFVNLSHTHMKINMVACTVVFASSGDIECGLVDSYCKSENGQPCASLQTLGCQIPVPIL